MRTLLILLSVAVLAALPAGCGAGDVDPAEVAEAAETTRRADTAGVAVRVTADGFGLPAELSVRGRGRADLRGAALDVSFDLRPILALAGMRHDDGDARLIVRGKDLFVAPPRVDAFRVPGGAEWLALDLERAVDAMGIDARGLGEVMTLDPAAQLDVLRAAGDVEEVGEEEVGGVPTTHYRGTIAIRDFADALPPERRERARRAIDALVAGAPSADDPAPFEVWIDEQDRIRRMSQRSTVPAQEGVPAGELEIVTRFDRFGVPLDIAAPSGDDVFDLTETVVDVASPGGPSSRGP